MLFLPRAAQDEKAMGVLNNVGGGWRLFWVLQVIGSSFGLAILVVRLNGSGDTVNGGDRCESVWATHGCSIYSWFFVLNGYPLAVTVFSLLVTRAVSRPGFSVVPGGLDAPTRGCIWWRLSALGTCWALHRAATIWLFVPDTSYFVASTAVSGTVLFAARVAILRGRGRCCRRLKAACARGSQRFRPVDRSWRRWLFWSGLLLCLVRAAFEGGYQYITHVMHASPELEQEYLGVLEPARDVLDACYAVFDTVLDAWLVFGMGLAEIDSPSVLGVDPSRALPSLLWALVLGWCFFEAYLAVDHWVVFGALHVVDHGWYWSVFPAFIFAGDVLRLVWRLAVGTLLWGWTLEVRAVAYWTNANRLVRSFLWCMLIVFNAARENVIT